MPHPGSAADEEEIRALEAAYDAAWGAGDLEGLLQCLSDDAVLINPRGEIARGPAEISRDLASVMGGAAQPSTHASTISGIAFVTADVAIVDGIATVEGSGPDGDSRTLSHRFTDVVVRRNQKWLIAHIRACPGTVHHLSASADFEVQ